MSRSKGRLRPDAGFIVLLNLRDPSQLRPANESLRAADDGTFSVSGQAQVEVSRGWRADVGTQASIKTRIQFDD